MPETNKWPAQGLDPSRPEHPQLPHLLKPEKLPNADESCSPVRGPGGNLSTDGSEGRHHLEFQLRHQGERMRRRERERAGTGEFEANKFNSSHPWNVALAYMPESAHLYAQHYRNIDALGLCV